MIGAPPSSRPTSLAGPLLTRLVGPGNRGADPDPGSYNCITARSERCAFDKPCHVMLISVISTIS